MRQILGRKRTSNVFTDMKRPFPLYIASFMLSGCEKQTSTSALVWKSSLGKLRQPRTSRIVSHMSRQLLCRQCRRIVLAAQKQAQGKIQFCIFYLVVVHVE